MSGPPDHWAAFSTKGMTSPEAFATALSNEASLGFLGPVVAVPSPDPSDPPNTSWVAVGGYKK